MSQTAKMSWEEFKAKYAERILSRCVSFDGKPMDRITAGAIAEESRSWYEQDPCPIPEEMADEEISCWWPE